MWHEHLTGVVEDFESAGVSVVPVIKSNGYGIGQRPLCTVANRLGAGAIAVGTVFEALEALEHFAGEVVVLEPVNPRDFTTNTIWAALETMPVGDRLIRTVAHMDALDHVLETSPHANLVLEGQTSMRRFGFTPSELHTAWQKVTTPTSGDRHIRFRGLTCHLPMNPTASDLQDVIALVGQVTGSGDVSRDIETLWVSHFSFDQLEELSAALPMISINYRTGSSLWLGNRDALDAHGATLSVVEVSRGMTAGYYQRPVPGDGWIVTVSGGTAHGVGLVSPANPTSTRDRFVKVAKAGEQALGRLRSPFWYRSHKLDFFETPHQHVSQLFVPRELGEPLLGDLLPVDVRYTITHADVVKGIDEAIDLLGLGYDDVAPPADLAD